MPQIGLACRYASLYFCAGVDPTDNELATLEVTTLMHKQAHISLHLNLSQLRLENLRTGPRLAYTLPTGSTLLYFCLMRAA